ncbi:MAG TPA: nuclear transport factor 2 family protein [Acidimicrobiales bacterium]|nr:nuclear transport factor 2 family protein [Acidimicrobiales bacterium]
MQLVTSYVDRILNNPDPEAVASLIHPEYIDHHPITIAPYLPLSGKGSFVDTTYLVDFLRNDFVDLHFILEDVFATDGRAAYRIYGEGTLYLGALGIEYSGPPSALPDGALTGSSLHLSYQCVGIFEIQNEKLSSRWGYQVLK